MKPARDLTREFAYAAARVGLRSAHPWQPVASLTPARVADILRRAAQGDIAEFVKAAIDIEEKDLHYRAVLQTRRLAIAGLPWSVVPADESRRARRAAQLASEALQALDISEIINSALQALGIGYAVLEIIWDTSDGVWLPARIISRPALWFAPHRDHPEQIELRDPLSIEGTIPLPKGKFIVHRPPVISGVPLLGALARSALWAWPFKSFALRDWARFTELYGQPMRIGRYHEAASPEDIQVLKQAVMDVGSDAAAVIPQSMAIELIEARGVSASADLYERLVVYIDRQISKAVLGQTLTTDQGTTGSLAQARVHEEVRRDIMMADARAISATITRDLIEPLIRFNLGDVPVPQFKVHVEEPEDTEALAKQLVSLAQLGVSIPVSWVHDKFGIPEPREGEPIIGGVRPLSPQESPLVAQQSSRFRCDDASTVDAHARAKLDDGITPDALDAMADRLATETQAAWDAILRDIERIVASATDMRDLKRRLLAAYGDLPVKQLAAVMAEAFAAADACGRFLAIEESEAKP